MGLNSSFMLRSLRRTAMVLAILVWLPVLPAAAEEGGSVAEARRWFDEAAKDEAAGNWAAALERFERVARVKPTPQVLLHIALCQRRLGRLVAALDSSTRALAAAEVGGLTDVVPVAREMRDSLEQEVPQLRLQAPAAPPALEVVLDGKLLAPDEIARPLRVDPGPHRVEARAPGHGAFASEVRAEPSRLVTVTIALEPEEAPSPAAGLVIGAIGLTAVAVGAVLLGSGLSLHGDIDDACGGSDRQRCPLSDRASLEADMALAERLVAGGAGVGVAGVVLTGVGAGLLLAPSSADEAGLGLRLQRPVPCFSLGIRSSF
jgi:hypothetical protein